MINHGSGRLVLRQQGEHHLFVVEPQQQIGLGGLEGILGGNQHSHRLVHVIRQPGLDGKRPLRNACGGQGTDQPFGGSLLKPEQRFTRPIHLLEGGDGWIDPWSGKVPGIAGQGVVGPEVPISHRLRQGVRLSESLSQQVTNDSKRTGLQSLVAWAKRVERDHG